MDGIHCYLLHQYDLGQAIYKKEELIQSSVDEKSDIEKHSFKENAFLIISQKINDVKKNMPNSSRFKKNPKYQFKDNEEEDIEFMEGMYGCAEYKKKTLEIFLLREEYDSDSVLRDIESDKDGHTSNIFLYGLGKNEKHYDYVKEYVQAWKFSDRTFSTGFTYYYWEYYRQNIVEEEDFRNINDRSGYQPCQLVVEKTYDNLKQEIMDNKIRTLTHRQFKITIHKRDEIRCGSHVKKLIAANRDNELHYGVSGNISNEHLLSVLLYCDWTQLAAAFSNTFRKSKFFKPIIVVKKQNSEYWNWSKLLRESVEYYGLNRNGDEEKNTHVDRLEGPFLCGLSSVKVISAFNIRLCGPTSTSTKIEVAQLFSGYKGIILQFNNVGDHMSGEVRAFDCSWISNYNAEREMLFIGGHHRMRLESVRFQETGQNFGLLNETLFYFDCMLNGSWMDKDFETKHISNDHHEFLNNM
eukprot:374455_1